MTPPLNVARLRDFYTALYRAGETKTLITWKDASDVLMLLNAVETLTKELAETRDSLARYEALRIPDGGMR